MKVYELIAHLSELPPNLDVTVWDAGNRSNVVSVDDSFVNEDHYSWVELNTDTDN